MTIVAAVSDTRLPGALGRGRGCDIVREAAAGTCSAGGNGRAAIVPTCSTRSRPTDAAPAARGCACTTGSSGSKSRPSSAVIVGARDARPRAWLAGRAVLAAERRLRRIARGRPERLLLHREASPLSRGALEAEPARAAAFSVYDFDDALQWDTGDGRPASADRSQGAQGAAGRALRGPGDRGKRRPGRLGVPAQRRRGHHPELRGADAYRRRRVRPRRSAPARLDRQRRQRGLSPVLIAGAPGGPPANGRAADARRDDVRAAGRLEAIIDRVRWSEAAQYDVLAGLDIGLGAGARSPYERGKCGYRLLQFGAAGVPVVASPVGVNGRSWTRSACRRSRPGRLGGRYPRAARRPPSRASRAGLGAREATRRDYSFDAWLPAPAGRRGIARERFDPHRHRQLEHGPLPPRVPGRRSRNRS